MTDHVDRLTAALAERYTIERELGAGGMATVYLAHDIKHDRKVAVKVLRPELAAVIGGDRFLNEIKVTANLQHPHILALFDSGRADSFLYYVMPYVEGESLRDKLNREKQLAIEESIEITKAVASALDYAHRHEVIHRDIKPENILVHDGEPLVADFGIALAISAAAGTRLTETGLSVGTPHYMSPEQASADRELDGRSDVYSLGVTLYEMLVGQPPFTAASAQAVVAKILTEEPALVTSDRRSVPPHVEGAIHKALSKLPADRFRDAAEFAGALTSPGSVWAVTATHTPKVSSARVLWPLVAVLTAVALWGWLRPVSRETRHPLATFIMPILASQQVAEAPGNMVAISPDGATIVYVGVSPEGRQLYARPIGELRARLVPGTEDAAFPFFSPDGRWVGFSAKREMRKISLDGGPFVTITPGTFTGASWRTDDTIVFSPVGRPGLSKVSAQGGEPEILTRADTAIGETYHGMPFVLPDERSALFTAWNERVGESQIGVVDLESGDIHYLIEGTNPLYAATGHLVYVASDGTLRAAPFDLKQRAITGRGVPILEGVNVGRIYDVNVPGSVAEFGLSRNGTLVYLSGDDSERALVLVDRQGGERQIMGRRAYDGPRFSPDGRSVVVRIADNGFNIWRYDFDESKLTKLTFDGSNFYPEWTPDGRRVSFVSNPAGNADLVWKRADGSDVAERLLDDDQPQWGASWAPDGRSLVYRQNSGKTGRDIWLLPLDGDASPTPLVQTSAEERAPKISPDGRFLAYVSDESGRSEIYVRTFPDGNSRWPVTTTGGTEPLWSRRGDELFYRSGNEILVVAVQTDSTFRFGNPEVAVSGQYVPNPMHTNYDIHPDGDRFVMVRSGQGETRMIVALNWFEALRRGTVGRAP